MVEVIKPMISVLNGGTLPTPPIWLMRQAGRYLPEYREVRSKAGSFLDLCLNPVLAEEVTLQPIRRYGFDSAILFSDILVVPYGLTQKLDYLEGEGPKLDPIRHDTDMGKLDETHFHQRLSPVYETVNRLRSSLPQETTLIGFAGSPWTVACYMVDGGGSKDFSHTKAWAYGNPQTFQKMIDLLVDVTAAYLIKQIDAGADALQLFDSWAGILPANDFRRWVITPTRKIVALVKAKYPDVPIIGFPRGAGLFYEDYVIDSGVDAVGLDFTVPAFWASRKLQTRMPVQGNLDPLHLLSGGDSMKRALGEILEAFCGRPYIFNLGHGIVPGTPPENVAILVDFVRKWKGKTS